MALADVVAVVAVVPAMVPVLAVLGAVVEGEGVDVAAPELKLIVETVEAVEPPAPVVAGVVVAGVVVPGVVVPGAVEVAAAVEASGVVAMSMGNTKSRPSGDPRPVMGSQPATASYGPAVPSTMSRNTGVPSFWYSVDSSSSLPLLNTPRAVSALLIRPAMHGADSDVPPNCCQPVKPSLSTNE